jgi:hypothetical protein
LLIPARISPRTDLMGSPDSVSSVSHRFGFLEHRALLPALREVQTPCGVPRKTEDTRKERKRRVR